MPWAIKDWMEHYETADTRKRQRLHWVPIQNKHDGKSFRRLMRMEDGLTIFGCFIVLVELASKAPKSARGMLADADGMLTIADICDKTGMLSADVGRSLQVLSSHEIGWVEEINLPVSADNLPVSADVSASSAVRTELNRTELNRTELNGHTQSAGLKATEYSREESPLAVVPPYPNGKNGFVPDLERFEAEYPGPVNLLAKQYYSQLVKSHEDEVALFANLAAWKASDQWTRGIGIKSAKNWLSEGDWQISPKTAGLKTSLLPTLEWIANNPEFKS